MASISVSTFKARVAAIPVGQNANRVIFDPSGKLLVITAYSRGPRKEHFYTVVRELDLSDIQLDPE